MNKKFAVILSGCGVYDGAEIHEATLTLLAIKKQGFEYDIFAPDYDQEHVINHLIGKEMNEKRNILVESARIARGNIKSLDELNVDDYSAIIFPGGFGVAKNLCSFAFDGTECEVDVETCIAPVIITKILGNIEVTVGDDGETIGAIENMGGKHKLTKHGEVVVDKANKIVSTPCYMLDASIVEVAEGIENMIKAVKEIL